MADSKISALSAAGALTGTELIELVQGGSNVKSTVAAVSATITSANVITALGYTPAHVYTAGAGITIASNVISIGGTTTSGGNSNMISFTPTAFTVISTDGTGIAAYADVGTPTQTQVILSATSTEYIYVGYDSISARGFFVYTGSTYRFGIDNVGAWKIAGTLGGLNQAPVSNSSGVVSWGSVISPNLAFYYAIVF